MTEDESVTSKATTLDALLEEHPLSRLDFVKLDVEGAEPEVLAGARQTLQRFRPRLAIATYHAPDEERRIGEVVAQSGVQYRFSYRRFDGPAPYVMWAEPEERA